MEDARQYLADSIAAEHAARENQRATRAAMDTARTRCRECRDAIAVAEEALAKARETDPDELIAAAREGRPPVLSKASEQRYALAAARDELEAAERTMTELRSRVPDAEAALGFAKTATTQAAARVIQDSPEWVSLVEKTRQHEQELITCYAILGTLSDAGFYHHTYCQLDPANKGDRTASLRMRQSADQEILTSWTKAFSGLSNDAQTTLPGADVSKPAFIETKITKPKRGLFAAK